MIFLMILLLVFFLICKIIYVFIRKYINLKYERCCYSSLCEYKRLGSVVAVEGKVGAGKSTLVSLFAQYHNISTEIDLINKMNSYKEKLTSFPFLKWNLMLDNLKCENIRAEVTALISSFGDDYLLLDLYYDYQNYYTNRKLLYDYSILYLLLKRDNFVLSDIAIFNQIKGNLSKEFNVSWLKLKETNTFPIDDYMLIVNDETLLTNKNDNALKRLNADSGEDVFLRLIRNASGGTMRFIGTMQDVTRWQKIQRELTSTIISVEESYLVGTSSSYLRKIERKRKFYSKLYAFFIKMKKDLFYEDSPNFFRRKLKKLRELEDKHINSAYVRFDCAIYNKLDNVGKKITEELSDKGNYYYSFVGPVNYCWGNLDTYYFKPVFEYLREISILKSKDLSDTKLDLEHVEELLNKAATYESAANLGPSSVDDWN